MRKEETFFLGKTQGKRRNKNWKTKEKTWKESEEEHENGEKKPWKHGQEKKKGAQWGTYPPRRPKKLIFSTRALKTKEK